MTPEQVTAYVNEALAKRGLDKDSVTVEAATAMNTLFILKNPEAMLNALTSGQMERIIEDLGVIILRLAKQAGAEFEEVRDAGVALGDIMLEAQAEKEG